MSNRVVNNASWMLFSSVARSIIGFVISILTIRYLGPSNFGLIDYAASLVAIVAPIVKLGFNNVMVAEIIENPEKEGETVGTVIGFTFVSSIVCYLGVMAFCFLANPSETTTHIICGLYSLYIFADSVWMVNYWFQAKLLSKYVSLSSIVVYLIVSLFKVFLLITNKSVFYFSLTQTLESGLLALALITIYLKLGNKISFSFKRGLKMFSRSKYYIISTLMADILFNMDRIMIKKIMGAEANGYYAAALAISMMTYFVFGSIIDSYSPQILEYKKDGDEERFKDSMVNLYSLIIYISILQALFIFVFARFVILILYGEAYFESISILRVLIISIIFNYIGPCRNVWILANNKHKILPFVNGIAMLVNFFLNYYLIGKYQIIGAAYATLITYLFSNVIISFVYSEYEENGILIIKALNPKIFIRNVEFVISSILNKN